MALFWRSAGRFEHVPNDMRLAASRNESRTKVPRNVAESYRMRNSYMWIGAHKGLGANCGCLHPRDIYDFFNTLVALGFLTHDGNGTIGKYRNTPEYGAASR
jgi:hypothetical protein